MEPPLLGVVLDSSVIIAAERKRQTVEDLLTLVRETCGEIEIAISAVTELKKHVPVHPVTDSTAEIAGQLGGEQASKGVTLPVDDLLIGASAIEQGYAVATLNVRHFQKIPGLRVLTSPFQDP
jgi:predicted nucleic acid-binding protein